LSYCWRTELSSTSIKLNKQEKEITSNLFHALQYLRNARTSSYMWIDALCIYSHRTAMEHLTTLRFAPQVFEGHFTYLASQIGQYIRPCFQI
jgi:hypothetical protein